MCLATGSMKDNINLLISAQQPNSLWQLSIQWHSFNLKHHCITKSLHLASDVIIAIRWGEAWEDKEWGSLRVKIREEDRDRKLDRRNNEMRDRISTRLWRPAGLRRTWCMGKLFYRASPVLVKRRWCGAHAQWYDLRSCRAVPHLGVCYVSVSPSHRSRECTNAEIAPLWVWHPCVGGTPRGMTPRYWWLPSIDGTYGGMTPKPRWHPVLASCCTFLLYS